MLRDLMAFDEPAPPVETDYEQTLTRKIIETARVAAKRVRPVTVEVFRGASQVAINRRGKNPQGKRGIIPDPNGPIDEGVWALKLSPRDGGAPALVFAYACHPVIVYGHAPASVGTSCVRSWGRRHTCNLCRAWPAM